jgi:hypothetical protein
MTITYIVQHEPLPVSSPEAPEDAKQGNRSGSTEQMKTRRMAFCNKYKDWTEADWSTDIYSDESMFRRIRATRPRVRRP